jgi:rubrerythrin
MEILTISAIVILVVIALFIIAYPLWQQSQAAPVNFTVTPGHTQAELEARYNAELAAIKDLMFDYEMGKVAHDDYNQLLSLSKSRAAKIRREMTLLNNQLEIYPELDAEIEALIAQTRRQALSNINGKGTMLRQVDQEIAELVHGNGHTIACPRCQARVLIGDSFCPACGHSTNHNHTASPGEEDELNCRQCGTTVHATDAFCAGCGLALDPLLQAPKLENTTTI